jgi:hypothetical protein
LNKNGETGYQQRSHGFTSLQMLDIEPNKVLDKPGDLRYYNNHDEHQ